MKIAVTYDNGEIFQHFGRTETFKVYEVEDGTVKSSSIVESDGAGHGALANLLGNNDVEVLICGGIGGGAQNALNNLNIEVVSGVSGDTDEAVQAYINGELISSGVNCNHHEEGHSCGEHGCGGGCSSNEEGCDCGDGEEEGGCGGCGGCGGHRIVCDFEGKNVGKVLRVHYQGTFDDGTQFDSSYDRGEPLEFVCGAGMMIKGFDKAVANLEVGEIVNVHLMPEEAYGESDPDAIITVAISELPGSEELVVGQQVYLANEYGQPFLVKVVAKDDENVTFDANHEMAGKELNFKIELVEVKEA